MSGATPRGCADGPIEIRRDEAGVPHVRAASSADALHGLGYCHGTDRPLQIVVARLLGQGRAAEVLDASDELVAFDTLFRRLDLTRGADEQIALLPTGWRRTAPGSARRSRGAGRGSSRCCVTDPSPGGRPTPSCCRV